MLRFFRRRRKTERVLVLGLDCASPELVFQQFTDDLPVLRSLMQNGTYGVLESSLPCITVPAWSSMTSSRDPGELGIYGFRNRADYSYDGLSVADGRAVTVPRVWDILGDAGHEVLVFNVPQTFPVRDVNGHLISGFMTPGTGTQFAYPAVLKQEALQHEPDYAFDVRNFRNVERHELLERIIALTDTQYRLFEHALREKSWQFAMHVNIGVDRIHHTFWRYHDPQHRLYEANSPFANAIRDYYRHIDQWLGRLIAAAGEDVTVIVVSDHGVKRMDGAIAINEWLWRNGWLALKQEPQGVQPFSHDLVDWARTRAWSTGGYYGRIFLNVRDREPQGIIDREDYEMVRDELSAELRAIPDDAGNPLHTQVFKPQDIYRSVQRIAPDLMVYFGDLHWRCVGSIGYGRHTTLENDTGPDDANHAPDGLYLIQRAGRTGQGLGNRQQLMDIAPTILDIIGVEIPQAMQGKIIQS